MTGILVIIDTHQPISSVAYSRQSEAAPRLEVSYVRHVMIAGQSVAIVVAIVVCLYFEINSPQP